MGNVVRQGLLPFLREYLAADRPFLGICVGMQLLFSGSEEFGRHEGIGFFPGNVVRFPGDMPARDGGALKVPHMGWNEVEVVGDPPALRGIPSGTYFYFVHSYYAVPSVPGDVACRSTYGVPFAAAVGRGKPPCRPVPPREEPGRGPAASSGTSAAFARKPQLRGDIVPFQVIPAIDIQGGRRSGCARDAPRTPRSSRTLRWKWPAGSSPRGRPASTWWIWTGRFSANR